MLESLFLLLIISIFILWIIWNYKIFIKIYAIQVAIILAIFYIQYWNLFSEDTFLLLSFIFAILIRLIIIPWVLYKFISTSSLPIVEREFKFWLFINLIIYFVSLWLITFLSLKIFSSYNYIFIWSIFMVVSGFLNFANHKKLIGDILSFLELENAVFLLSLLALHSISFYIELWVIVDVIMSLAILIISTVKIKNVYWTINIDKLSSLKD